MGIENWELNIGQIRFPLLKTLHQGLRSLHSRLTSLNSFHAFRRDRLRLASALVLFVASPPDPLFVTSPGGTVKPLVHAPEAVQSARIGGIGVIDAAVLEHERAHARPFARVGGRIGSAHGREGGSPLAGAFPRSLALVVVFDAALALLLPGESDAAVEVAAE